LSPEQLLQLADANYFATWRLLAAQCPDGDARSAAGLLLTSSGFDVPWLNIAFVTAPLADPEAAIDEAAAWYGSLRLPWLLRVRARMDDATERAAEAAGMRYTDELPAMVLQNLAEAPAADGPVRIERVCDAAGAALFSCVCIEAFDMPVHLGAIFTPALLDATGVEEYIGYAGEEPVATALLACTGEVAGIYNIGTLAGWRGRGIGEAMTRHAIEQGRRAGCAIASLQASEMGRPVYERMGFRTLSHYRTFAPSNQFEDGEP
jgi:GNAT superfamily N-acetyltransferase